MYMYTLLENHSRLLHTSNMLNTEPSLKALLRELHPVHARWYNIGLELEIPNYTLDSFKPMYSDQLELMREMLIYWLDKAVDPPPSWEAVVAALRSPIVDMTHVAEQLELQYCATVQCTMEKSEENEGIAIFSFHNESVIHCSS